MMSDNFLSNRLTVDVLDRALTKQGAGPIQSCASLTCNYPLSRAGTFRATFPLRDPQTDLIVAKTRILDFYYDNTFQFRGVVEAIEKSVNDRNDLVLVASGRDMMAEWAETPVGFLDLSGGGSGVTNPHGQIFGVVNSLKSVSWANEVPPGSATTDTAVYTKFAGESCLSALIRVGEHIGEHWRVGSDGARKIVWLKTATPSSGVRAVGGAGEPQLTHDNDQICYIQQFSEVQDASGLYNKIIAYGGGVGDARLDLTPATRTPAAGFAIDTSDSSVRNTSEFTANPIARTVEFKDIRPISNTSADLTAAANALYDAAYALLTRVDEASDNKRYALSVAKLPTAVKPGTTIDVEYYDDRYEVDETLVVQDIVLTVNADGARYYNLTVTPVATTAPSGEELIAAEMERGRIFSAHPQRNANSYTTGYTKHLFNDGVAAEETAVMRFRLGDEVVQVQQILLEFETAGGSPVQMLPLESTVRSVSGTSSTTDAGGASAPTSGASSSSTTVSESSHTHTVTIAAHTHDVPDHQHDITIIGNGTGALTYDIGYGASGTSGGVRHNIDTNDHTFPTDSGTGGVTSDSGGGSTPTSAGGSSHSHNMDHTHVVTIGTHTHDFTPTITAAYGLFREVAANTFHLEHLVYRVNGSGTWYDLDTDASSIGGNWYQLDITSKIVDADSRPSQANNTIEFARKDGVKGEGDPFSGTTEKSCTIDALLSVRNIIQAIAYT